MKEITANRKAMRRMVDERIKQIATIYGYDAQSRQCIEEMAELTQAINKLWRKELKCGYIAGDESRLNRESAAYNNVVEEIADVEIMLEQMKELLNCTDDVKAVREEKLERQIKRVQGREKRANGI